MRRKGGGGLGGWVLLWGETLSFLVRVFFWWDGVDSWMKLLRGVRDRKQSVPVRRGTCTTYRDALCLQRGF